MKNKTTQKGPHDTRRNAADTSYDGFIAGAAAAVDASATILFPKKSK